MMEQHRRGVVWWVALGFSTSFVPGEISYASQEEQQKAPEPTLDYQSFRRTIELQVEEKREAQIKGIERLLDLGPDPEELPELKFRLAELYYEKSRAFFFKSQRADERTLTVDDAASRDAAIREKEAFVAQQREWVERSLAVYQEIKLEYPTFVRMPEVLFAMGQVYWNTSRPQQSIDVYAELIRNHPESPLVPEAWLAFGEFYFDQGDVNRALGSYEKAAEDKRSRVYGFALYKQGWCYYNMAQWREALRKFKATVLYAQLSSELSGENKIALGREAEKDYVRTYQHVGSSDRAGVVFADLLGVPSCTTDRCKILLENLANLWMASGNFDESASLFRQLIRMEPGSPKNAVRQSNVVDLTARTGSKKRVVWEAKQLVEMVKSLPEDSDAWEESKLVAENNLRRLAQIWNKEARKTRDDRTLRYSLALYEDYLALFSEAELAYVMRFQLADMYFKLERFDQAASAYEATVAADDEGQFLKEAANDAILAIEEHIRDLRLPDVEPAKEPSEIHPQKLRLVQACDTFLEKVTDASEDKQQAIRFKAAKVFYDANHFDEALQRFSVVVQRGPRSEQAEFAANLVLDIHNLREDWDGLYGSAMEYRSNEALVAGRRQLTEDLAKFAQAAKFKLVQRLESQVETGAAEYADVARGYQEFFEEFPDSPDADKALFNASVAWDRSGRKERATHVRQRLLDAFPDSPLRVDVAHYQAKQFEERTQYVEAARAYREFARKYPKDERARDALYNAAVFYAAMGQVRTASDLRLEYLESYGSSEGGEKEAADIFWRMAEDLDQAGNIRLAVERYAEFSRRFPRDDRAYEAMRREASIRRRLRQVTASERIKAGFRRTYPRLERGQGEIPEAARRWRAEIELEALDTELRRYARTGLSRLSIRNPEPFKQSVAEKAAFRDRLIAAYGKVVTRYREATTSLSALLRIAQVWDGFVEALTSVPCPRGISEDACLVVKEGIETQAGPARDAALQAFQTCVSKSAELQVYTEDSKECLRALEERGLLPALTEMQEPVRAPARFEPPPARGPLLRIPDREDFEGQDGPAGAGTEVSP